MRQLEVWRAQRIVQVDSHDIQQTCQEFDDEVEHSDHYAFIFKSILVFMNSKSCNLDIRVHLLDLRFIMKYNCKRFFNDFSFEKYST